MIRVTSMRARKHWKRALVALLASVLVLAFLSGFALAGRAFLYCHATAALQFECCCGKAPSGDDSAPEGMTVKRPCCCERGALPSLPPSATAAPAPALPPAPLLAKLDVLVTEPTRMDPPSPVLRHSEKPPPSPAAARARLGVFLL